jgi:hemerythrin-like domain-containing protein
MFLENQPNIGEDFIRFHRIVTRSLGVAIESLDEFLRRETLEESKREGFLKYVESFSSFLEGHHLVENEKVFPYFQDKLPEVPYERLMAEHQEVELALEKINQGIISLRSKQEEIISLKSLKSGFVEIDRIWLPHIQIEESKLYGKVGSLNIDPEEMLRIKQEFSEFFGEHTGPAYLVVPFALYNLSSEDRAILAQGFPDMVTQQLVPIDWKDEWISMQPYFLK